MSHTTSKLHGYTNMKKVMQYSWFSLKLRLVQPLQHDQQLMMNKLQKQNSDTITQITL